MAILAPVGNFWWSGFPPDVVKKAWRVQFPQDQRAVWVAHHLPWLTHWWNTQKLFRGSSVKDGDPAILSREDRLLVHKFMERTYQARRRPPRIAAIGIVKLVLKPSSLTPAPTPTLL